jgi:phosphotransferase system  glucose/maltose/N-acetylglucosamine-specific IIC component
VGAVVAYLYNKFKNIQLPKYIAFFSGVRFIPIITFGTMCVLGMLFGMI